MLAPAGPLPYGALFFAGVANEVVAILDTACSPQRTAVQRCTQSARSKLLGVEGLPNRPFDKSSVHLSVDKSFAKGNVRSFAERWLIGIQTVQHQLPSPIHEGRFDHFVVGDAGVGLQNDRQG